MVLPGRDHVEVEAELAAMDANGIAKTALSIDDPGPEWFGGEGPAVAGFGGHFSRIAAATGLIYALGMIAIWWAPDTSRKELGEGT